MLQSLPLMNSQALKILGALEGELGVIRKDVNRLVSEMNEAIKQSNAFIQSMLG